MNELYQDDFDSRMLCCNAYKLHLRDEVPDVESLRLLYSGKKIDILFCFATYSGRNIAALQMDGFSLVSIRNTYTLPLSQEHHHCVASQVVHDVDLTFASQGVPVFPEDDLTVLIETIGSTSRYYKDALIPRETSLRIYKTWLYNSLFNGYAADAVLATKGKALIGVHTLRIKNDIGIVDLIGVQPAYQQLGLGQALLQTGFQYFHQHGVNSVEVVTEGENVPASRFYQKNGFLLSAVELVWHKHMSLS